MSWQAHLSRMVDLDDEDPQKWQLAEQFVQVVGAQFLEGPQTVQNRTDGELELRGRWHGYPARLKLGLAFGSVEWELKGRNPTQSDLYLHWDEDAIPNVGRFQGPAADDWGDDDGEQRVFFGRGFYLDASGETDRLLAIYQALPEPARQALATYVPGDRILHLYLYASGDAFLAYRDEVHELPDPINALGRGVWVLGRAAWGLSQVDPTRLPAPQQSAPAGVLHTLTCPYCRTLFLWSQNQACPNCGAAPQA